MAAILEMAYKAVKTQISACIRVQRPKIIKKRCLPTFPQKRLTHLPFLKLEKVSWTEHKTNEEILETIGEERSLIRTIKTRQKKWIGHTLRGESLLKTVIEGKMLG